MFLINVLFFKSNIEPASYATTIPTVSESHEQETSPDSSVTATSTRNLADKSVSNAADKTVSESVESLTADGEHRSSSNSNESLQALKK